MKKTFLFILGVLIFSISTADAKTAEPFNCRFRNSENCGSLKKFWGEFKRGCASPSSNCLRYFCERYCQLDLKPAPNKDILVKENEINGYKLCRDLCSDPKLLKRLDIENRERLSVLYHQCPPHLNYKERSFEKPQEEKFSCRERHLPCTSMKNFSIAFYQGCTAPTSKCRGEFCGSYCQKDGQVASLTEKWWGGQISLTAYEACRIFCSNSELLKQLTSLQQETFKKLYYPYCNGKKTASDSYS